MSNAIYPTFPGLKWGTIKTPIFNTSIVKSASGRELRAAYYSYPQWRFRLKYEVLRQSAGLKELETLLGFFCARKGSFDTFLYQDPDDNTVTNQTIALTSNAALQYRLVRNIAGFTEPIFAVDGTPEIKAGDSVLNASQYTITDGLLSLTAPLNDGLALTWSGQFFYRCRFEKDMSDFEGVLTNLYKAGTIEMITVKP